MERITHPARTSILQRLEQSGRSNYQGLDYPCLCWSEDCYYSFTHDEVSLLYSSAETIETMVRETAGRVISERDCSRYGFSGFAEKLAISSWEQQSPTLLSRFDFGFDGTQQPKLFECHSDLPNLLLEAARIQWDWKEEVAATTPQANCIENELLGAIQLLSKDSVWHIISFQDRESMDLVTYLAELFRKACTPFEITPVETIGQREGILCTSRGEPIKACYKVFGWDSVILPRGMDEAIYRSNITIIEPAWKGITSTKQFLVELWERFPNHPLLLPTFTIAGKHAQEVRKSALSWGGNGVELLKNGVPIARTAGTELTSPFVYQEHLTLKRFEGYIPTVSVFVVNGKGVGIGVREDLSPIVNVATSRFVPHLIS